MFASFQIYSPLNADLNRQGSLKKEVSSLLFKKHSFEGTMRDILLCTYMTVQYIGTCCIMMLGIVDRRSLVRCHLRGSNCPIITWAMAEEGIVTGHRNRYRWSRSSSGTMWLSTFLMCLGVCLCVCVCVQDCIGAYWFRVTFCQAFDMKKSCFKMNVYIYWLSQCPSWNGSSGYEYFRFDFDIWIVALSSMCRHISKIEMFSI